MSPCGNTGPIYPNKDSIIILTDLHGFKNPFSICVNIKEWTLHECGNINLSLNFSGHSFNSLFPPFLRSGIYKLCKNGSILETDLTPINTQNESTWLFQLFSFKIITSTLSAYSFSFFKFYKSSAVNHEIFSLSLL